MTGQKRCGTALQPRQRLLLDLTAAAAALTVILLTLFSSGQIGLSDNGDFSRVMNGCSLLFAEPDRSFLYIGYYRIDLPPGSLPQQIWKILTTNIGIKAYPNIQLLLVRLTVAANLLFNVLTGRTPELYRLWTLAAVYILLYAGALFFLFRQMPGKRLLPGILCRAFAVLILCDVGYTAYFNSFYSEPLQIIGLVLCAGCLLRNLCAAEPRKRYAVGTALAAILYGWSKFANIPAAVLWMLGSEFVLWMRCRGGIPALCGVLSAAILIGITGVLPDWMDRDTNFNSVFYGVVKDEDEDTAARYLEELGLNPGMAEFRGEHAYVVGAGEAFREAGYSDAFYAQVGKTKLLRFYLTHPALLWEKTKQSLLHSGMIRPYYLGNADAQHPRFTLVSRFELWGKLRQHSGLSGVWGNLLLMLCAMTLLFLLLRKKLPLAFGAAFAIICAWGYQLLIPYISNGYADLSKHMFSFVQIQDLLLLFLLCAGTESAFSGKGKRLPLWLGACGILLLAAKPAAETVEDLRLTHARHDRLEAGAWVSIPAAEGEDTLWLVTGIEDGTAVLLAAEPAAELPFSSESNFWTESSLRRWLNEEYPNRLPAAVRTCLRETGHPELLGVGHRELAESGKRDFTCEHLPELAAANFTSAYQRTATDRVALPDALLVSELSGRGYRLRPGERVWLMTPYYNKDGMVRCLDPDGFVCFREAWESCGVCPVLYLDAAQLSLLLNGGQGSVRSPFRIKS